MNTITYMLYENLGVRAVWKAFLNWAKGLILSTTATIKEKNRHRKSSDCRKKPQPKRKNSIGNSYGDTD